MPLSGSDQGTAAKTDFAVLFVCTGNICRSPVAERLFRARLRPDAPVTVSSAGTRGLVGRGIDPPSADALRALGVDPAGHAARRLDPAVLARTDLVLTASSEHRAVVVQASPLLFRKAFTLREFARLGAKSQSTGRMAPTPDELAGRVQLVAEQRGLVDVPDVGADDISDPFGVPASARPTAAAVSQAVDDALRTLGLTVWRPSPRPRL